LSSTAVIGLLQTLLIFFGFVAVRIVLKMNGYPADNLGLRWNPLSVFLREHGLWLVCLPVCWTLLTLWAERNRQGPALHRGLMVLGLLVIVAAIAMYSWASLNSYAWPSLYYFKP
jgi:hypothetical protein